MNASAAVLLGFAVRARKLVAGLTAVQHGTGRKRIRLIVMDASAGQSTRQKLAAIARQSGVPIRQLGNTLTLAEIISKPNCRCVGITDAGFAKALLGSTDLIGIQTLRTDRGGD